MSEKVNFVEQYGPWALVVGASQGLGAAWAEECAKRGQNVAICARTLSKLDAVAADLRKKYGVETRTFSIDISAEDCPEKIYENVKDLDLGTLIYNAAIETGGYFIKVDEKYHRQQVIGNAMNPMVLTYKIARDMAKRHRGCILLISSMAGVVGTASQPSYGAAKSFMAILGESLWYEMQKYGVYAAGVTVGSVATPNYVEQQAEQGTNMEVGESYEYDDLIEGLEEFNKAVMDAKPHTPADVAAYVLDHVGTGPRLYTHDEDEAAARAYDAMPRKTGVTYMSRNTDKYFSNYSDFNAPDADEFVQIKEKI